MIPLALLTRLVGSKFAAGAIIAGLLATAFVGWSGYLVHYGYEWAQGKCEAASLKLKNEQLATALAEKERELAAANEIQKQDAQRAADAETQLRANEESINATPVDPDKCLDRDGAGRVRNVR